MNSCSTSKSDDLSEYALVDCRREEFGAGAEKNSRKGHVCVSEVGADRSVRLIDAPILGRSGCATAIATEVKRLPCAKRETKHVLLPLITLDRMR